MDWLVLTFLAFFAFGLQDFLYKVASVKKSDPSLVTISFLLTVASISFFILLIEGLSIKNLEILLLLSFANGILFSLTTMARLKCLRKLSASLVFPIIRMSLIVVIIWAVLVLGESLSFENILGIIFTLLAIFLLKGEK